VVKVPVSGLFRHGNGWAAYVVRAGKAELVPVQAGPSGGGEIQVIHGLGEGDEVILYPGDRIRAGQRVKPTKV
jgi:HlyD family secretion protein